MNIDYFSVCPTGLVVDDTIVYTGNISIQMTIKLRNELLSNYDSSITELHFRLALINNGTFNYFISDYMNSNTPNIDYSFYMNEESPSFTTVASTINDKKISSELLLSNDSLQTIDNINLLVVYKFDFSSYKSNFTEEIYNKLGDNPLSFVINMEIM